jgi:hypothetical protein
MIGWASGSEIGVRRFPTPLRRVAVLAIVDTGLDTTLRIESICEVLLGGGVLELNVSSITVGLFIDHLCAVDGVEVM